MNKIKNLISKTSIEIKELVKNFKITMILIAFVTIILAIFADNDLPDSAEKVLEKIIVFCAIWGFGTFFTETYSFSKLKRLILYAITAAISLIFVVIGYSKLEQYYDVYYRILAAYLISIFAITIYKTIKKQELNFSRYILNVFRDLLNNAITYGILAIGITLLAVIFVELILDGNYGNGLSRIHILLLGLFYVPSMLYSISAINKKEINSFVRGLVLYVFLPLVIVAMIIIYIYIAKIIILRDIPKNFLYRILAGIFIIAFPVWNMASCYCEEKKWTQKITTILPFSYIPFFFLEIYSIGVRINEFGITPARYLACAFCVFQMIAIFLNIYKNKEKLHLLFIIISTFAVVLLITPLNYSRVSNLSQKRMIEKNLKENSKFEELDEEAKQKVKGAYSYLSMNKAEKYLPSYLNEDTISKIKQYTTTDSSFIDDYIYFYDNKELDLNIEPYSHITDVSGRANNDTIVKLDESNQNIDLSELLGEILKQSKVSKEEAEKYFKENNLVYIDATHDLFITSLNFQYNDEKVKNILVDGYLLTR